MKLPAPPRVLFLTRDPLVHQLGGSTTYAFGLLQLLTKLGAQVTILSTSAASRSPRPWFRLRATLPDNVVLLTPGYLRVASFFLRVWSPRPWARYLLRAAERWPALRPLAAAARTIYGEGISSFAWDLTEPTAGERKLVLEHIIKFHPSTLLVNYAYWGTLLADPELAAKMPGLKRVILMHDLLSARVRSFESQGRALDCLYISEETEIRWLNGADTLLAAQVREAEVIAPKVRARVLVLPVTMSAHEPAPHPEPGRCLFVGSRIAPNENALSWLRDEVWPIVRAQCPQATLAVVGTVAHALEATTARGVEAGIEATGPAPSLDAEYHRASVCLVPLRIGSGIKIKLLEALSFGKAIVTTSVGVEGLEEVAAGVVDIADDPAAFAAHIIALLTDDDARRAHERSAHTLASAQFDPLRQLDPAFLAALL